MKLHNFVTSAIAAAAMVMPATAQNVTTIADINQHRVEQAVLSKEQVKAQKAMLKQAKKQAKGAAKRDQAQGWIPAPGTPDLVTQYTEMYLRELSCKGKVRPPYYLSHSTGVAGSYGVARKLAEARCRAELAEAQGTRIAGIISESIKNIELTRKETETIANYQAEIKQHFEAILGRSETLIEAIRETDESVEVLMYLSYSWREIFSSVIDLIAEKDPVLAKKISDNTPDLDCFDY